MFNMTMRISLRVPKVRRFFTVDHFICLKLVEETFSFFSPQKTQTIWMWTCRTVSVSRTFTVDDCQVVWCWLPSQGKRWEFTQKECRFVSRLPPGSTLDLSAQSGSSRSSSSSSDDEEGNYVNQPPVSVKQSSGMLQAFTVGIDSDILLFSQMLHSQPSAWWEAESLIDHSELFDCHPHLSSSSSSSPTVRKKLKMLISLTTQEKLLFSQLSSEKMTRAGISSRTGRNMHIHSFLAAI